MAEDNRVLPSPLKAFEPFAGTKVPVQLPTQFGNEYSDQSVRYETKSKVPIPGGGYTLKNQETRFYSFAGVSLAMGDNPATRSNYQTRNFICTGILLQFGNIPASGGMPIDVRIYDTNGLTAGNMKFRYLITEFSKPSHDIFIDLSSCPRKFISQYFNFYADTLLDTVWHMELFGFDEEI